MKYMFIITSLYDKSCIFLQTLFFQSVACCVARGRILVQVTIYRRLLIGRGGRDGHLDQSEAYDIS